MYSSISLFLLKLALTLSCPLTSLTCLVFCRWGVQCALARDSDPYLFMFELHSADERGVKLGEVLVSALRYRKYKNVKATYSAQSHVVSQTVKQCVSPAPSQL